MFYGEFIREVEELNKKTDGLYIYGAGLRGKELCHILTRNHIRIEGFIVTQAETEAQALGFPIITASTVMYDNIGIIIGLGDIYTTEVKQYLKEQGVDFGRVVDGGKYISQDRGSKDLQDNPTVEITTVIGCKVNCKYCPQNVLLGRYFEKDRNRKRVMTLEDFKVFLRHTPDKCDFMFAGMSEPYLNPDCTEMLKLACEAGKNVSLYTTLEGITKKDVDEILRLPFQFVGLHVADEKNYAKITVSEDYYEIVERMINATKPNGEPFINDMSAQAAPLPRILEMCRGKYEVLISLQDRAGNLKGDDLAGRERLLTEERITCCFSGPKLNNHVVLPDGTLLLCNMDYGMQHVLGNLLVDSYDEIRKGEEMRRVFAGIAGNQDVDLLCRKCLFAMVEG
ncbi:radical SAM/SPASM domain-containing protein [uncultured Acetatifactor sp.]|jgi:sulfatase maturation enzyme AslB (radical SAM superfamily)|uniref:radical SAM/SPASM domain-containing protein n=1 Tax=uncultured Acetatifactor sp. TaxID=1671927 RepID=UPI002631A977|nr:radical SAM/SPASM domain-containing protein [uncultured Acetatifactor sp.]